MNKKQEEMEILHTRFIMFGALLSATLGLVYTFILHLGKGEVIAGYFIFGIIIFMSLLLEFVYYLKSCGRLRK